MSGACATDQARKGRYVCTLARGLDVWIGGPHCKSNDFFTLFVGPLEHEIHVFSDGVSENDRKSQNERVHKFYSFAFVFAGTVNLFSPTSRGVPGSYSDPFCEQL